MHSAQQSGSSFFCDVAAMRLRFGCDAKCESLCEIIDVVTLGSLGLWLAAELEGELCPYSSGAGRDILRQAGTWQGRQSRFGAGTFAYCVLGRSWSPKGFGKASTKRWVPHITTAPENFGRISFQNVADVDIVVADVCSCSR